MSKTVKNWGGTVVFHPKFIRYPTSHEEVVEIIKTARQNHQQVRVIGSGHSWTSLVNTDYILVSLDQYQGIETLDKANCTAVVKAGTKLKLLGELLHAEGLAMENMGDINVQSIAGALSTGTHGTGVKFGTLATQMLEITFVNGLSETIVCSEHTNREVFKAAQISLGALGIITKIKLRLVPTFKLEYVSTKADLDDTLLNLEKYKQENRNFEFYWFPYTKTVQLKFVNKTPEAPKNVGFAKKLNDVVLENGVFGALSRFSRAFPKTAPRISKISAWGVSKGTYINHSHLIFATQRLVRFYEMEYNIPQESFINVIKEIEACIHEHQFKVHFPIECRWVKADDIMISPASDRDSAYIAIHMYKGMEYKPYFDAIEQIFRKYKGRPHYGKMNTLKQADFAELYPNWQKFMDIRQQMDPDKVFLNEYLQELFVQNALQES
ncbi:MAG TPA: FAD-binding oxidoreductase [Microscillaceae bacterium]|nr:FAD-binding oxidoreductase [Microscillaceae bacterium]